MQAGYAHPDYARSLAAYGSPRELPRCKGWVLERVIPEWSCKDAMGCYPLFDCQDWSALKVDLDELAGELVSICLVADPFGRYTAEDLHACFPDKVVAFKKHYVLDLACDLGAVIKRKTRQSIKAGLRHFDIERCSSPLEHLDEWVRVYGYLVRKHGLTGLHQFSRMSFALQMAVPGYLLFRAVHKGRSEAMLSWYVKDDVAYAHLMGISPLGYELGAAYAMFWTSIQHFLGRVRWLDLGGGAGARNYHGGRMAVFKRKWASTTRTAYLCGRILNRERYAEIIRTKGAPPTDYFPAYRLGEFG